MATYATASDVATRLNVTFSTGEEAQATALLEDVSAIMRGPRRLPQLDAWIAAGKIDAALARAIACQLAMQAITVTSAGAGVKSETHPEYSITFTDAATAGLDLTDRQIEMLTPPIDTRGRAFNIHPG